MDCNGPIGSPFLHFFPLHKLHSCSRYVLGVTHTAIGLAAAGRAAGRGRRRSAAPRTAASDMMNDSGKERGLISISAFPHIETDSTQKTFLA